MGWPSRFFDRSRGPSGRCGAIGVDFTGERIAFVQVSEAGSSFRLRDARSVDCGASQDEFLSSKSDMRRVFQEVLRRGHFSGKRIVTHAPTRHLRLMVLNYSLAPGQSEPEQILGLARERMRDDLTEHVVDYLPIRTSGEQHGERSALVAIVPEEPVVRHLESLRRGGLEVVALEIAPIALRRVVAGTLVGDSSDVVLVLRIGARTSELTLFSGRRLLLYREIDLGVGAIVDAVSKALDCDLEAARELMSSFGVGGASFDDGMMLDFEDGAEVFQGGADISGTLRDLLRPKLRDLVEQAHKAISYAAFQTRGTTLDKLYLMQGDLRIPGIELLLSEMMQTPVDSLEPMSGLLGTEAHTSNAENQAMTIALGFAMRGMLDV